MLTKKKTAVVIVLDETDHLRSFDVLYSFSRSVQFIDNPEEVLLGTICITNDMHYYEKLPTAITSSFGNRNYIFKPYNADDINEILTDRARLAFYDGVLDELVIPLCSAFAAQEYGDARMGIELLYTAGLIAKEEGCKLVTEKHVKEARIKLTEDEIADMITPLPFHVQIGLYAIAYHKTSRNDTLTTGMVETQYIELCRILSQEPLTRTSVSKMISKLDTAGLIGTTNRTEPHGGVTRVILMSPEYVKKVKSILELNPLFEGIPKPYIPISYQMKFI